MPVSDGWSRDEVPTSDAHCFLAMYLDVRNIGRWDYRMIQVLHITKMNGMAVLRYTSFLNIVIHSV